MALRTCAQDVIRCDLCEKEVATMYCDFCHVNLCISCIGKHISDKYDSHKIVPFEQRKSTLIYPKCTKHQTKSCKFYCKECKASLCSFCTTLSDAHKKHTILSLFDLYSSNKEVISKDNEELENVISLTYQEIATELEDQIANLDGEYEKLVKAVLNQGEEWHRNINIIIGKMKAELEEIKLKHTSILKAHLDEIKSIQNLIEQTQLNLSKIEESNEVSKITEYSSKNKELNKLPPKVQVSMPTFSPNPIDTEQLYKLIGSLLPLSTIKNKNGYRLKKSLMEPKLLSTINTGYKELHSVTCINNEEIWTTAKNTDEMKCLNTQGLLMKTVKTKSKFWHRDIAVSSDGDLVYTDLDGESMTVNTITYGKTKVVLRLQGWVPRNICVTSSCDILVAMFSKDGKQSKVVRYSGSTEKQVIQFDNENKPLYSGNIGIKYITENKNHDICVADCAACKVVVVNEIGKLRFRYNGLPFSTKHKPFKPHGIATDSRSQILTSDFHNHCIHVLDKNGEFLSYIDNCDLKDPHGLYVDKNDDLFLAEYYTGNVKKIKYLE